MTKKILFFTKPHGVYVAGDVAGFDPAVAAKLSAVAVAYDPEVHDRKNKPADPAATSGLDAKLADLAEREADVLRREAALAGLPAGEAIEPAVKDASKGAGEPPKVTASKS
jgi:hypothetical protein